MLTVINWYIESTFAQISTGVLVVAGLLAAGWFFPPFRKWLWGLAGIVAALLAAYTKGARDAKRETKREWNDAIEHDVEAGREARNHAERVVRSGGVRGDEWDRDKGGM